MRPNHIDPLYFIAKRPCQNSQTNMTHGFNTQAFAQPSQNNWTAPMP